MKLKADGKAVSPLSTSAEMCADILTKDLPDDVYASYANVPNV